MNVDISLGTQYAWTGLVIAYHEEDVSMSANDLRISRSKRVLRAQLLLLRGGAGDSIVSRK